MDWPRTLIRSVIAGGDIVPGVSLTVQFDRTIGLEQCEGKRPEWLLKFL